MRRPARGAGAVPQAPAQHRRPRPAPTRAGALRECAVERGRLSDARARAPVYAGMAQAACQLLPQDLVEEIEWTSVECLNQDDSFPAENALKSGAQKDVRADCQPAGLLATPRDGGPCCANASGHTLTWSRGEMLAVPRADPQGSTPTHAQACATRTRCCSSRTRTSSCC